MDSAGIGVMIGRYKQVQSLGGRIAIACPNEKIEEMIQLSGLSRLLPSFVSLDAAIAYAEIGCSMKMKHGYFLPRNQKMRALPVYLPQAF